MEQKILTKAVHSSEAEVLAVDRDRVGDPCEEPLQGSNDGGTVLHLDYDGAYSRVRSRYRQL